MGIVLVLIAVVLVLFLIFLSVRLRFDPKLHTARFSRRSELRHLLTSIPRADGLFLGKLPFPHRFVSVVPQQERRELGNLLIVAPTRSGKGLLATSQLFSWKHSVIINDIKGELFAATAGYRSTIGEVFVIDPTGVGHCYDPLLGKQTEDEFYSSASQVLFTPDEGDGAIFTQRATGMLTQIFVAARKEGIAPLPYARSLLRSGLKACAERLNSIDPQLATQFLDINFADVNLSDRFLLSAWGTLTARTRPLLTETVVRCFTHADVTAKTILCSERPVTVYLRWPERDLLALSPLVRLLWGSLIDELITTYDATQGSGCQPVLILIDEAGRTAIPTLADHATTVVGRGISLWVAIQSLSQLESVYGKARSQTLRDNMESQIYYRPNDIATAKYLEERLGNQSAFAQSHTLREGEETSQGLSERPISLMTAQEIAQMKDEDIIGFHRHLRPFHMKRMDWRTYPLFQEHRGIQPPVLSSLPPLAEIPAMHSQEDFSEVYIDPDIV
jgi:type IV secretion system protein VirD4